MTPFESDPGDEQPLLPTHCVCGYQWGSSSWGEYICLGCCPSCGRSRGDLLFAAALLEIQGLPEA